jgi:lipoate synthase
MLMKDQMRTMETPEICFLTVVKRYRMMDHEHYVIDFVHFSKHNYAIKSSRIRGSRHVACMGKVRNSYTILIKECKDLLMSQA